VSGIVKAISKVFSGFMGGGDAPPAYNPLTDPAYIARERQVAEDRERVRTEQDKLAVAQEETRKQLESDRRDQAAQTASRSRARRYGGARALLSQERLNPEVGLNTVDPLA
jgi:hypothetical protein